MLYYKSTRIIHIMIGFRDIGAKPRLTTLLLVMSWLMLVSSMAPTPRCKPNFFYRTLPLIADESAILNLDNLFDGYNLKFSLKG